MRHMEIDVVIKSLPELKQLEKRAAAMGFTIITSSINSIPDFSHPTFCTAPVPPVKSDAEAAHELHWRASDLLRLKFNVTEHRLVWSIK